MLPSTINGLNKLPPDQKRELYRRIIPPELVDRFGLSPYLVDEHGKDLLKIHADADSSTAEMSLYHKYGFPDPVFYGQITDTLNGQFHILLYVLNDPDSPRFNVDRMPDGTPTKLGAEVRNLEAELDALKAGLSPGQIRKGLRLLRPAVAAFEAFVSERGHDIYFAEPLFYHNAILFEQNGFAYEKGRRRMERIQQGFQEGGELRAKLDGSTPFRMPEAANSIRLRSWAIHDGILGEPFTDVTVYKRIGHPANLSTCQGCTW